MPAKKHERFVKVKELHDGISAVQYESGLWSFIDSRHISLCGRRFKRVGWAGGDLAVQRDDGLWNFLDKNGKFLCKKWKKGLSVEDGELQRVRINNRWNLVTLDGRVLFKKGFWSEEIIEIDVVVELKDRNKIITIAE